MRSGAGELWRAPGVTRVRSSRRQGGGRSELLGSKLKSGRHELVIRSGSSTAQKFWKIDSTRTVTYLTGISRLWIPTRQPTQSDWLLSSVDFPWPSISDFTLTCLRIYQDIAPVNLPWGPLKVMDRLVVSR